MVYTYISFFLNVVARIDGYTTHLGDCPGNEIASTDETGVTLNKCAEKCNDREECVAFLFHENNECFLKSSTCIKKNQFQKSVFYDKDKGTLCLDYIAYFLNNI